MYILGISAYYHDSAAALIKDEFIVAAAQEERFTRIKHDSTFPKHSIDYCLAHAGIDLAEVDKVVFYDKPFLKFERLLETYLAFTPRGFRSFCVAIPVWIKEKLFQKHTLLEYLKNFDKNFQADNLLFSEHHLSHAASAFFASPFKEALILTMDGVGEWATTSLCLGKKGDIKILKEIYFPHSLGLLYSAFTYYCGFKVNSGEYKLMGLAPYGQPKYKNLIESELIDIKDDGSFRLNQAYLNYSVGLTMTNKKFDELFGAPARQEGEEFGQFHMDIAASIQAVVEEIVIKIARDARRDTGIKNLCMAGGVALNCVANGKLMREKIYDDIWIQPASGDAGGALGCALVAYYMHLKCKRTERKDDLMQGSYLGPSFATEAINNELKSAGAIYKQFDYIEMIDWIALQLARDKVIGWFQGRMEFGPRALGNRSILGNPMSEVMQKKLNLKIKYRESFRPFAPAVLAENVNEWFESALDSPYMLLVSNVRDDHQKEMTEDQRALFGIEQLNVPRSTIPAVTHVDYSARVQTVHRETNPEFYDLLSRFKLETGCPVLINTSFNVRGEPIVCSPTDAFKCFMGTDMDILVVGNFVMVKSEQNSELLSDYSNEFALD